MKNTAWDCDLTDVRGLSALVVRVSMRKLVYRFRQKEASFKKGNFSYTSLSILYSRVLCLSPSLSLSCYLFSSSFYSTLRAIYLVETNGPAKDTAASNLSLQLI